MLKLEELTKGAEVVGIDPLGPVVVVSADTVGEEAVTVYYKGADGERY